MWITNFTQKIENWAVEMKAVYKLAERYYRDVVQKEVVLANISADDHILCIGGGICPFSAILLHQCTGARVTVIDNNSACVPLANNVIQRLGLEDYVTVNWQEGAEVMPHDYTVVHFALQVCPMECVFSHVETHAAPGTKFLIRRPKSRLRKLYSALPAALRAMLTFCPFTTHKTARNIGSTLLYIKPEADTHALTDKNVA